jgi:hypothetical protein
MAGSPFWATGIQGQTPGHQRNDRKYDGEISLIPACHVHRPSTSYRRGFLVTNKLCQVNNSALIIELRPQAERAPSVHSYLQDELR